MPRRYSSTVANFVNAETNEYKHRMQLLANYLTATRPSWPKPPDASTLPSDGGGIRTSQGVTWQRLTEVFNPFGIAAVELGTANENLCGVLNQAAAFVEEWRGQAEEADNYDTRLVRTARHLRQATAELMLDFDYVHGVFNAVLDVVATMRDATIVSRALLRDWAMEYETYFSVSVALFFSASSSSFSLPHSPSLPLL